MLRHIPILQQSENRGRLGKAHEEKFLQLFNYEMADNAENEDINHSSNKQAKANQANLGDAESCRDQKITSLATHRL
jgi:hypothetical protein